MLNVFARGVQPAFHGVLTSNAARSSDLPIMFTPSLLAAMTIAGAFWVGVLAARRLRDWGDNSRVLDRGEGQLALASGTGPSEDPSVRRVRARVAERVQASLRHAGAVQGERAARDASELDIDTLRLGDIVSIDATAGETGGDAVVEGLLRLHEGGTTTIVAIMADGETKRWLIGARETDEWLLVEPVHDHGLAGEPPRNVQPRPTSTRVYALARRGQASVAALGDHGRPSGSRVGTYVYRSGTREAVWLERWGNDVLLGEGRLIDRHTISFLPGSP
jgi:hypothetical protein